MNLSRILAVVAAGGVALLTSCSSTGSTQGGADKPSSASGSKRVSAAQLNARPGEYWLGQRVFIQDQMIWGWVKRPDEPWEEAVPVLLREEDVMAPHRELAKASADHNYQYKLYGYFWEQRAYEPVLNRLLDVFVLQGVEPIGPAQPLPLKTPTVGADMPSRGSRSSARSGNVPMAPAGAVQYERIE